MCYDLLPTNFVSRSDPFRLLPAEMVSKIFSYLDNDSLLNIIVTCERFRRVCFYDPKLRKKLLFRTTEIWKMKRNQLLNPRFDTLVVRKSVESCIAFTRNLQSTDKRILEATKRNTFIPTFPTIRNSNPDRKNKKTIHRLRRL